VVNSNSLRIKMEINVLQIKLFFLKLRLGKHKGIAPLVILGVGVALKVADVLLTRRKKK